MNVDFTRFVRGKAEFNRYDLTHLMAQPEAFAAVADALCAPFHNHGITKVAALEAMGLALGGAVAARLGAGLVIVRKAGRIAWDVRVSEPFVDYTGQEKRFEIAADAVTNADRALIVDDWSETGSQLRAAITLLEQSGATVMGAACLHIEASVRAAARLKEYILNSVLAFDEEENEQGAA